jgi:hypothetical protein
MATQQAAGRRPLRQLEEKADSHTEESDEEEESQSEGR